eukprot:9858562-Alexandrium_andersonii.AAC.1
MMCLNKKGSRIGTWLASFGRRTAGRLAELLLRARVPLQRRRRVPQPLTSRRHLFRLARAMLGPHCWP